MGKLVVGVDGSETSADALRWAVEEARLRAASLDVVYAYEFTAPWRFYPDETGMSGVQYDAMAQEIGYARDEARQHASGLLDRMIAGIGDPRGVPIEPVAVPDHHPAQALIDRSRDADLLVVGTRGLGGFKGLLLGSVSHQCVTHARCPVVIVRPRDSAG